MYWKYPRFAIDCGEVRRPQPNRSPPPHFRHANYDAPFPPARDFRSRRRTSMRRTSDSQNLLRSCQVLGPTRPKASLRLCRISSPQLQSWVKTFPDPSDSPAHHTCHLSIRSEPDVIATATVAYAWIRAFCNIVNLTVETNALYPRQFSLVPLHALSPTLKSLRLVHDSIPTLEVFSLICSLPSLEDLELEAYGRGETDVYALSPTSPKFTGILSLSRGDGVRFDIWSLLALPSGLHFTAIRAKCLAEDLESITSLVSACCNTLESLTILQSLPGAS